MIFGLLYYCVVILCVNRSRSSFILYRIVKRHSRQSNVRRIWTCADNDTGPLVYYKLTNEFSARVKKAFTCHRTYHFRVLLFQSLFFLDMQNTASLIKMNFLYFSFALGKDKVLLNIMLSI